MASFFKKLAKATPALTQGLVQGTRLRMDMDEAEARRELAKRNAILQEKNIGIREQELDAARRKRESDEIKQLADQYGSGLMVVDGMPQVNPAFTTPGTDLYNWSERNAALKRSSPQATAPRLNFGQIYAQLGKQIPSGLDPNAQVPDTVAARLLGANGAPGNNSVLTADQLKRLREGTLTGDIPVPSGYINAIPRPEGSQRAPLGYRYTKDGNLEAIPGGPATRERVSQAPPGYRFTPDGNLEPIPGGPAILAEQEKRGKADETYRKNAAAEQKQEAAKIARNRKAQTVIQDANRALAILEKQNPGVMGAVQQSITSRIPGTEAADLERLLDTVKTIGAFEELQSMRDSSPTGGALGSVTEGEHRMLQATIGNLEASSSPSQRAENLKRVINTYMDIVHGPGNGPDRYQLSFDEEGKSLNRSQQRANGAKKPQPSAPADQRAASAKKLGVDTSKIDQYPRPGDVRKGYRYKGGDPSVSSNWEKVQ